MTQRRPPGALVLWLTLALVCGTSCLAAPFTVVITDPSVTHKAKAGNYITYLDPDPFTMLAAGATEAILTLYQTDYADYTYQAGEARQGVLTISRLDAFQDGTQGGLDIIASFAGDPAPEIYRWIQYIEMSAISPPLGAPPAAPSPTLRRSTGMTTHPFTRPRRSG